MTNASERNRLSAFDRLMMLYVVQAPLLSIRIIPTKHMYHTARSDRTCVELREEFVDKK